MTIRRPNVEAPGEIRDLFRCHLDDEVLPFWVSKKINDPACGGYLPFLDRNLEPTGKVQKHVIVQLRMLYVHAVAISRATAEDRKAGLFRQYRNRFDSFRKEYLDAANGGVFNYPRDAGPGRRDFSKETGPQVHAVYFLTEIYLIIGDREALELARNLFLMVDRRAHDEVFGGYISYYELPRDDPRNRVKTLNVQMHMLLALTRLCQAVGGGVYRRRFEETFEILTTRFVIAGTAGDVYNALRCDWQELRPDGRLETKTVYGHSAELIWYVLEGATVAGKEVDTLAPWLTRLTTALLERGVTRAGALYLAGSYRGGVEDRTTWWWAQAEAMVALLRVHETTRDPQYWTAFEKVRRWTFEHMVPDRSGTWVAFRRYWGLRRAGLRAGGHWQSGFHVTRAMLQCLEALDRIIARRDTRVSSLAANDPRALT